MLREKMLKVMTDVNSIVAEREELTECMALAILTKKNLFILGDTGQAKSYAINELRKRIIGTKQFERLLSKQTDEEALFGRIDLKSLIEGCPKMITTGKIPDSHIVFLDEIFKSNEGVLNSLLTALNERRYTNESETVDIPVISFMSASNEIPNFSDPTEAILKPLYDSFDLKIVTNYIEDKQKRLDTLANKQNSHQTPKNPATITLDELYQMQEEVKHIVVPMQINELMDDLLCQLRSSGIHISDRKYLNFYPLTCAKAWLEGRTTVVSTDLLILKNYLWSKPEEITTIGETLESYCINPMKEKLKEVEVMATEIFNEFKANVVTNGSMRKFRNEMIKVYEMTVNLKDAATNENETNLVGTTFDKLETYSKEVHERTNFTYVPLSELKEMAA